MSFIKEKLIESSPRPVSIETTEKILSQMKNSICKIYKCNGTGFFCKIPFKNFKALITNNHIINKEYIKNNKIIKISLNDDKEEKDLELNKRKIFLSEIYDITIIEIKNSDNINVNYLQLDDNIFKDNSEFYYENNSIYVLHYPNMSKASVSYGIIKQMMNFNICHTCYTEPGSSGSPIMNLLNNKVIGIHKEASKFNFNIGSFIKNPINKFILNEDKSKSDINIIKKINNEENIKLNKNKISNNNIINELNNKYKNNINLIYFSKYGGFESIFGYEFVKNNKNNFDLIINGIEYNLIDYYYELKKGENNIQLIIKNKITNLEYMFYNCICLKNIDGLKYLDTKNINNFSYMFFKCHILSDINALQNWDVSNAYNFESMFSGCSSLSDINGLQNWNISNVKNFNAMFKGCSSSLNLKSSLKWKISEAQYESMK